jgi:hypothetical protein
MDGRKMTALLMPLKTAKGKAKSEPKPSTPSRSSDGVGIEIPFTPDNVGAAARG